MYNVWRFLRLFYGSLLLIEDITDNTDLHNNKNKDCINLNTERNRY